MTLKEKTDN